MSIAAIKAARAVRLAAYQLSAACAAAVGGRDMANGSAAADSTGQSAGSLSRRPLASPHSIEEEGI